MASRLKCARSPVEVYKAWVNCCLAELSETKVNDLTEDLQDGSVLCRLIKVTTGHEIAPCQPVKDVSEKHQTVTCVIDYMKSKGIEVSFKVEDITNGELKSILDILWLTILHFEIHSARRAAYQRTVNLGKRFLLQWCCTELPNVAIDPRGTFMEFLQSGVLLAKLIAKYCPLEAINPSHSQEIQEVDTTLLFKVLNAAEVCLGIPKEILSSSLVLGDVAFDEYALIIYMAVLRRKICAMKGGESCQEGGKLETSPFKLRSPLSVADCSINGFPHNGTLPADPSSLSPNALRDLVAQHNKSHADIQALQERVQSVSHQSTTPRLQKKLPENLLSNNMVPTEGSDVTDKSSQGLPQRIVLTDHNDNLVLVDQDKSAGDTKDLYTSVDKQFFDLMLDAVQKGFIPPELTSAEKWLNSDASEVGLNEGVTSVKPAYSVTNESEASKEEVSSNNEIMLSCGSETEVKPSEQTNSGCDNNTDNEVLPSIPQTTPAPGHEPACITEETSVTMETKEQKSNASEPDPPTPGKRVQFLGLDTVFVNTSPSSSEEFVSTSVSPDHLNLDLDSKETIPMFNSSPQGTVTWASLDLPAAKTTRAGSVNDSQLKSKEGLSMLHTSDGLSSTDLEKPKEESEDPFMLYLNSIEQTALKFKVQVEQAKVDTLEALKTKLELAYEGTPLEDIPLKFQEKLQETIAQIASDEVLKKYEALVGEDEEMSEEENEILLYMRNELDSVASENFQLHQQLELLKDYEKKYLGLRDKFDNLDQGMTSMRSECEKKNGESEFLAERVESLEKNIVTLRVEYNNETRELQNENLELQKLCFELEGRNRILEEDAHAARQADTDDPKVNGDGYRSEKFHVDQEMEILQMRLEESERQNKALRAAAQADQAMIQCMEYKKEELEGALVQSQDNHSKVLLELHEAQRQMSSDRVKLSSYQEESDALRRENKLVKSSLEIAQQEIEYLVDKRGAEKSEPWKNNKKMIWREIRELEKILKDVHKEKRNLEKKYVNFKQENDQLSNSLSLHGCSPPRESSEKAHSEDSKERLKSKSWHSSTQAEHEKAVVNGRLSDDESFSSPPRKVKSWLDSLDSSGLVRNEAHVNHKDESPVCFKRSPVNGLIINSDTDKPVATDKQESGCSNELNELRHHVGSLEAEKAAIVKELSSLRFSRIAR